MVGRASLPEWRKDWQSDLPVWDKNHPLYKLAVKPDDEPVEVANEYATTRLHLPNIDDGWLSDCLAKTAAIDRFQDAANLAPTVALESYAIST